MPDPAAMPANHDPAIYHMTHIDNLAGIVKAEGLWSDTRRVQLNFPVRSIAYAHIKQRRLARAVPVAAHGFLGEYVPFYFCPRSPMLYPIFKGHPDYSGGQSDVVFLVSSARSAIATKRPWAFTDRHAELGFALYYDDLRHLDELDWEAIGAHDWRDPVVRERKQAEFLVHDSFPWSAVTGIGVHGSAQTARVQAIIAEGSHLPSVQVISSWYY
jgi:hypothetical protein